ncbi:MAG: M60 family metallopeptidase, partial [Coprobacter sp.]|nr:M60 family metallopeptidase [Coprobacter sp.]
MKQKIAIFAGIAAFAVANAFAVNVKTHTVYRIESAGTPGQSITVSASGQGAVSAATNTADPRQQWYITTPDDNPTAYYLQNVASGGYLKSARQTSASWFVSNIDQPDDATMLMTITDYNGNALIRAKADNSSYGYAHKDAANNIVCWEAAAVNTQWRFVEVPMTQEELDEIQQNIREKADEMAKTDFYQNQLDVLFEDKACTSLRPIFNGDFSRVSSYRSLPQTLRDMVDKVNTGNWAETDGNWDTTHALKYRVQLYEPYSEGSAAAGMAGVQAYTNMNNPTGILANSGELLYVMVDDPVPDGATLYIGAVPDEQMYNSVTAGVQLHQGLNAVRCYGDHTHYFIYYTVNTVQNGKPVRKVTDCPPLKIHIEGGRLNGFFNYVGDKLYTPDTREDFLYTTQRATHIMYDLVGKYAILHFFLNDIPSKPTETTLQKGVKSSLDPVLNPGSDREHDPVKIMKAWDNMCFSERILMGLQNDDDIADDYNRGYYASIVNDHHQVGSYITDPGFYYSDYFNNRMMGISQQGDLYMNATSWRTAYNASTISYVLTQFYHDGLWGPAHEYGHMNQGPINLAGTTEVSNNIFSNVALYFSDRSTTSRCDYITDGLASFYQNKTFLEYGAFGATRMYWQLWCYYHATRHNPKFYPRLYEL